MSRLQAAAALALFSLLPPGAAPAEQAWGNVKGQLVWAPDQLPQPVKYKIQGSLPLPACLKGEDILLHPFVVDPKTRGVQWAVVWLQNGDDPGTPLPIPPDLKEVKDQKVVLDQPCCTFAPHVVALREGQTLVARNSADFPHNVTIPEADINELTPAGKEKALPRLTAEPLPMEADCSFHPWMKAWVAVFPHPYFAVTDAEGRFEIPRAPAGKYRIVVWQETVGYVTRNGRKGEPIDVRAGDPTEVKFELTPKDD